MNGPVASRKLPVLGMRCEARERQLDCLLGTLLSPLVPQASVVLRELLVLQCLCDSYGVYVRRELRDSSPSKS
jgi:hypothetical protein